MSDAEPGTDESSRLSRILSFGGDDRVNDGGGGRVNDGGGGGGGGSNFWGPDDLGAILQHQLSARLETDLPQDDAVPPAMWQMTFEQLLHDPRPPVELLQRVKRFAKACKLAGDGPLPPPVATVLYFASIVVARMRCGQRISELDDDSILRGMQWVRAQTWLDEPTRSIFEEATAIRVATA